MHFLQSADKNTTKKEWNFSKEIVMPISCSFCKTPGDKGYFSFPNGPQRKECLQIGGLPPEEDLKVKISSLRICFRHYQVLKWVTFTSLMAGTKWGAGKVSLQILFYLKENLIFETCQIRINRFLTKQKNRMEVLKLRYVCFF